jgi:hypothetical protein
VGQCPLTVVALARGSLPLACNPNATIEECDDVRGNWNMVDVEVVDYVYSTDVSLELTWQPQSSNKYHASEQPNLD